VSFVHPAGESGEGAPRGRPSWGLLRGIIRAWALTGGLIILALVLITAASALSNLLFNVPFSGEYELAKRFVGIAIFTFLPYCQLTGANVTVDIFTQGSGPRAKGAMALLSSLLIASGGGPAFIPRVCWGASAAWYRRISKEFSFPPGKAGVTAAFRPCGSNGCSADNSP
jgi:TRAP-type C4-dicarboxylate transport system permease small subunit